MNPLLVALVVIAVVGLGFGPWIAGAVITRRASKRTKWPEVKLAYRGFLAQLVLIVLSAVTLPSIGFLLEGRTNSIDVFRWTSLGFSIAGTVPLIVVTVAMYKLARRSAFGGTDGFSGRTPNFSSNERAVEV